MIGILSALGAASSWTFACYLWRKQTKYFSATQINLIKNVIAFFIFSPIILTLDFISNWYEIVILLLSGVIGIAIGDSFYIASLKKLGTRRTLTVEATLPIISTLLGLFLLNEMPSVKVCLGTLTVSLSLIGVASQQTTLDNFDKSISIDKKGFLFAFISILCAVIGAILSRLVLKNSNLNPFQTTEIRLLGSLIVLIPFVKLNFIKKIRDLTTGKKYGIFYATFLGTNLGILLQQNVFLVLPIGLGWTLLSTSPAFALFFLKLEGEKLNWQKLVFTFSIILGVAIVLI